MHPMCKAPNSEIGANVVYGGIKQEGHAPINANAVSQVLLRDERLVVCSFSKMLSLG
jgi:hypothetical protein